MGKSGGKSLIAPERIKWLGRSRDDAQLQMCLVVTVKSDAVENNTAGTWNVRSMNQGKLDIIKYETA